MSRSPVTIAVVPVQRLEQAKSRLASRLSPEERRALVGCLLERVLDALSRAGQVSAMIVVSPDPEILARAAGGGAIPLEQTGSGLNAAIRLGQEEALRSGADRLLVVLGDLPLLTAGEVDALLARPGSIVLAPDRHGEGTNLLALRPPDLLAPVFGAASRERFHALAAARGLPVDEFNAPGTAFDLDTPADLAVLGARASVPRDRLCGATEA